MAGAPGIAAPMIGGLHTATLLALVVLPVLDDLWRRGKRP